MSHGGANNNNLSTAIITMENQQTQSGGTGPAVGSDGLLGHLWIVTGSTGEYSDRCEWTLCAYRTAEEANRHVELAQAEADRIERTRENRYNSGEPNKYDSRMQMDYTGTSYHCEMVELRSLP